MRPSRSISVTPTGEVSIKGEPVALPTPLSVREGGLAYVPEERMKDGMIQEFSVAENMILRDHHKEPFSRSGFLILRISSIAR